MFTQEIMYCRCAKLKLEIRLEQRRQSRGEDNGLKLKKRLMRNFVSKLRQSNSGVELKNFIPEFKTLCKEILCPPKNKNHQIIQAKHKTFINGESSFFITNDMYMSRFRLTNSTEFV